MPPHNTWAECCADNRLYELAGMTLQPAGVVDVGGVRAILWEALFTVGSPTPAPLRPESLDPGSGLQDRPTNKL